MHYKNERTFTIIKPDGIQRSLIGEVVSRFERVGLKLIALKMMIPTADMVEKHYTLDPAWKMNVGEKSIKGFKDKGLVPPTEDPMESAETILECLREYITSGPIIAMVWQGAHAVKLVRKLVGGTEPLSSDVGTIRGDYMLDSYEMSQGDGRSIRNLIHASGSVKEAEDEIAHWFEPSDMFEYSTVQEQILYSKKLDILGK